jgi:hypothetical protein
MQEAYPAVSLKGYAGQGGEILQFANTLKPTFRLFSREKKFFPSPITNAPYRE